MPPRRFFNLYVHYRTRGMDEDQRAAWDADLARAAAAIAAAGPATAAPAARPAAPVGGNTGESAQGRTAAARAAARWQPGLAPPDVRPPSWWRGDAAAWSNSIAAAKQLGEPAAAKA